MKMTHKALIGAGLALVLTASAFAQTPPTRIRGQIEKVDGSMVTIKARDGAMLNVKLDEKVRVSALVKATLAGIKPDRFFPIARSPEPDGSIKAYSIHIFLPAQRGVVADRY